jgi:hypothetical protein
MLRIVTVLGVFVRGIVTLPVPSGHRMTPATAFFSQGAGVEDT